MKREDGWKAVAIYKKFSLHAEKAVDIFEQGRRLRNELRMDIPKFSHPPAHLVDSLEKYLVNIYLINRILPILKNIAKNIYRRLMAAIAEQMIQIPSLDENILQKMRVNLRPIISNHQQRRKRNH